MKKLSEHLFDRWPHNPAEAEAWRKARDRAAREQDRRPVLMDFPVLRFLLSALVVLVLVWAVGR